MNEEMATRLAQELLDAADEDARARVVVRWLPDFARCQVATAARVKLLVAELKELNQKMDAYHNPKTAAAQAKPVDPRLERLKLILAFGQKNWQSVAIFLILLQAFGVLDKIVEVLK